MSAIERRLRVVRDGNDAPALPLDSGDPGDQGADEREPRLLEGAVVPRTSAPRGPHPLARLYGRVVSITTQPDRPTKTVRVVLVAVLTAGQGGHSWTVRAWDGITLGVYRRQIRAAEAVGDREALAEWVERKQQALDRRRTRLAGLPSLAVSLVKLTVGATAGLTVLVFVIAIAVQVVGAGTAAGVLHWVADAVRWLIDAAAVTWSIGMTCAPVVIAVAAWREGRRRGETPAWLVGGGDGGPEGRDVIPDEGAILNALRHLGISELNRAFKGGWRPRFPMATHQDGKGHRTQLELPAGVTVEMINKKKKLLAHNLVRFPIEVWPTEPTPGVLDLWVANPGALSGPVDPWPLLADGGSDYFKGVPVGVNIRGKTIIGRLSEANYALAGMMGSGKSTLIIDLLLGALLDPLVDAEVFVMAVNADYDPMKPRLRTLLTGTGEEIVEACLNTLRNAYADLDVRGRALKEHGERAVNRRLAERDARLRPRIIVVDECQALFMHETMGEEAVSLTVRLLNAARKYGYTLIFATPEPSSASLPRKVMAVTSNKACFAIGDQQSNDSILGTGSYTAGISAVSLEPKTDEGLGDVGTCMAKGFEPKPGLLRCFYVSQSDARAVVERAMKLREQAGISRGGAVVEERRDLLEDLAAALGGATEYAADLPPLLAKVAPRWEPYRTLTGKALREELAALGVKVPSTGNKWPISPELIREALIQRQDDEAEAE